VPVHLGGNAGVALMKNLTNSSPIIAEAINISANNTDTNSIDINNTATNRTDGDLWSWGSRPHTPPAPPTEAQYRDALNARVIMDNRVE
jgi:hypothetical protein